MAGADLIIEVGGAGTMQKSIMSVKPYGTIALIGVLAGGESSLSLYPILMQGVKVQGVIVGSRSDFVHMNRAIEQNKMKPVVDKVFGWKEVPEALEYLQTGKHFGKVVVSWE
ncbi:zinc-binding alcohol dehydrogenase [Leptospira ellinghausenii]|uniref:Zinc-binding alcohol dehydrogenase n=1 Tax=Leptospira ellinghausenii TaxID=1917822 RepID=A0A2P2DHD6_9LEPT|nr:zinc-binding alcohol dehydrogenase [Leptospira ellinghausenii]